MGLVRPLLESDIEQVVAMNGRLFPGSSMLNDQEQERRFRQVCFGNPWYDERMPSLVYDEGKGSITGFVAIVPRRMMLRGRSVVMSVSQHLMVEPGSRASLAALDLTRTLMSGPQDLTVADMSVDISRKIWERLGGITSHLYSLHWRKPLKPFSFVLEHLRKRRGGALPAAVAKPFAGMLDSVSNRLLRSHFRMPDGIVCGNLEAELLLSLIPEFYGANSLLPAYDEHSLRWLLETLRQEQRFGTLQAVVLRGTGGKPIGWFIYHLRPGGTSEVLQIGAREASIDLVLGALFAHAAGGGAVELIGRMEPKFMRNFAQRDCICMPGRSWVLVSSSDPELRQSFYQGDAFFSRLEGDPWFL